MSFLAPLFLLGLLAVAGPVIFHMVRRAPKERVKFSSLMFLRPTPPQAAQRSRRIQDWLLLLLRAAALILLATAFARPFLRSALPATAGDAAEGARVVVLVDASASMKREGLWDAAKAAAAEVFQKAAPNDRVALVRFSGDVSTLTGFDQWSEAETGARPALALAQLDATEPDWSGTRLAAALIRAAEMLVEDGDEKANSGGGARRVVVVGDFQEGGRLEGLQAYEWPKDVRVELRPVRPARPGNAGLQPAAALADTSLESGGKDAPAAGARARVINAPDSTREQFQVGWAAADGVSFAGTAADVYVPPGQSRVVTLPWPAGPDGSPLPAGGRLLLRGDDEPFDNTVFAVPPAAVKTTVLAFGAPANAATDQRHPLFFLSRALPRDRAFSAELEIAPPDGAIDPEKLNAAGLYVLTGPAPEAWREALRAAVQNGKTALVALTGSSPEDAATLAALAGAPGLTLEEASPPSSYAMLTDIDFRHPLFSLFADPRFGDFTKIRFWNYRRVDAAAFPDARPLARFDTGDPAILEIPAGAGRLVVFAAGWHPLDSQLALSSKFPPLLAALLEWSGGGPRTAPAQFQTGDAVPLAPFRSADKAGEPLTVILPDGSRVSPDPDASVFQDTRTPGVYQIVHGGETRHFAVNPDPAESRTAPLPPEDLERLGVPLEKAIAEQGKEARAAGSPELSPAVEAESRQKLWRWFIAAALAVLILETLLGAVAARRASTVQSPVTP